MCQRSDVSTWLTRIEAEYREMPGMRLTEPQIQRLWGLDGITCAEVIEALLTEHILTKTRHGAYVRADANASA
jgi:hypothetical protein